MTDRKGHDMRYAIDSSKLQRNWAGNPASSLRKALKRPSAGTWIIRSGWIISLPGNTRSITRKCTEEDNILTNAAIIRKMRNNRDKSLDIAKAICIILMVVGHSGCPTYLYDFVYMFHMPCFFFVSGWLLNEKYVTDLKTGLIQKAKGSYYPFVMDVDFPAFP